MCILSLAQKPIAITVIGAGAYGTAIAVALSKGGNAVVLWGHNSKHIEILKSNRSNPINLPNIPFPPLLYLEKSLSIALSVSKNILIAVPSYVFSCVLLKIKINLTDKIRVIIASKGLEPNTGRLLKDVVDDVLGNNVSFAIISGPTFARELAIGLPTAITLTSNDVDFSYDIQKLLFSVKNLRVYRNTDVVGVQVAGAVKNVIAIGVGISDGLGFGANARTALITRGLAEMSRLGVAMGATDSVFSGLAGLGDLVLTCIDNQSRNRRFGVLLGEGINIDQARKKIGQVIEGVYSAKAIHMLSIKHKVIMPITNQIYQILYENKNIYESVYELLRQTYVDEIEISS
ncbi:glycerol-3-phosphate dehydrogenase [Candidatus Blochmanniella vafra str. BVAF]|uniref:Glycerol-3-phosphate dehydrogenase [NAD(P)+] n=1 Tax=Blochmanniella vafra (strain BVAF) TaxID=859654 RepID=E8Q783_BLOVB|nr:NAD(P)H-dependent glycerol-3-phosphate dehydrogenase [Candidatus Blochmannia vafer]ADV33978.1 glycerol-3-phosphate dehydrogenase [Candidatus Blochmannia vafer str. BVAF]